MLTTRDTAEALWARPTSLWEMGSPMAAPLLRRPADAPLWRVSWTADWKGRWP